MFNIISVLLVFFSTSFAFASQGLGCFTQVQETGRDMKVLGYEGIYVGTAPGNKAAFYDEKLETLYIYEDGLNSVPLEIPWTQATDLRWKENEFKNFTAYKSEGAKSYFSSLGIRCGATGGSIHPLNSNIISTAKASTCVEIGQPFSIVGGKCCEGLTYNPNTRTCDEPSFRDPELKACSSDSQCEVGMGCLPQNPRLMFTKQFQNDEANELNDFMREVMDEQTDESEFLASGKSCTHSSQCESYNCEGKVCKEAKVCRFGEEGEKVTTGTRCNEEKHLVKNGSGTCELSPESQHSLYLGLYDEHHDLFTENPEASQCQFNMSEGVKERTRQALKSLRAMEWLFATISRSDRDDCFQVNIKLRDQIGKPFVETRKYLLQDFSTYYSSIKRDYETVKTALMSNTDAKVQSDKQVEIHSGGDETSGEVLTEHALATRQSSGYDTMMFMYRRNLLFQSYERGMLTNIAGAYEQVSGLSQEMAKWNDGNTSWSLGDRTVSAFSCEAKYKKLTWKGWKTKRYNNVANRWTDYYEVTGSKELNLDPATDAQVIEQLKVIGNLDKDEDILRVFNRKHYLLDPLMPGRTEQSGGLAFTNFGTRKSLRSGGLFGFLKKRDLRNPRYLKGVNTVQSYTGLRDNFKDRIVQFYKDLKTNPGQQGFIYEPELISTDAIDCVDKIGQELDSADKCSEFNQFIDDLTDYGMAHFLAYSYHTNSKYSNYFTNSQTWRRRLFTRLEVDLQNLHRYYEEIIRIRDKQSSCLESLINHVSGNFLNGGNTVGQGGKNYYDGGKYNGSNAGSARVGGKIGTLSQASRDSYSFKGNVSSWRSIADSLIDSSLSTASAASAGGNLSTSGASVSPGSDAFRRGREMMDKSNKTLSEKGVNLDDKNSRFLATLAGGSSSSNSSMGGSSMNGASSSGSSGSSGIRTYSGGGGFDLDHKDNLGGDIGLDSSDHLASIAPGSALGGAGRFDGRDGGGYGSRSGSLSEFYGEGMGSGHADYSDPTGMTDDEKGIMMANYERTRGRYNPQETDSLFDVVSKAYVRNLNKILTRKKRVD